MTKKVSILFTFSILIFFTLTLFSQQPCMMGGPREPMVAMCMGPMAQMACFPKGPQFDDDDFILGNCCGKRGFALKELIEELDLTDEQELKLIDMKYEHQKEVINLRKELQKKFVELRKEFQKENPDLKIIDKLVEEIESLKVAIKKSKIHFIMSLRSVLTKEQWEKLKEQAFDDEDEFPRRKRMIKRIEIEEKEVKTKK